MVGLQHPGVSENLVNLIIGIAMGKERALVDERDAVRAASAVEQSSEPRAFGLAGGGRVADEDQPDEDYHPPRRTAAVQSLRVATSQSD
jgi:hypothetical protein